MKRLLDIFVGVIIGVSLFDIGQRDEFTVLNFIIMCVYFGSWLYPVLVTVWNILYKK